MSDTRSRRKRRKRKIWIIPVIAAAVAVAVLIFIWGRTAGSDYSEVKATDQSRSSGSADTVQWKGKAYKYNSHLSNYLLIGVDSREPVETTEGQANAGQADAIYLASWNRVEGTVTLITIPRDTMTNIEVFLPSGESAGMSEDHISLSYAFGDGGHKSCRLTEQAVSDLFYGLPIQSYCAVNLDGLPVLTESVGNLSVTVPNDSLAAAYPEFQEGAQVTLTPENTETFVRYRDITVSQSALDRTERQQAFISAFGEAARSQFAQDPGYAANLYLSLEPYMVTSMSTDQFADLAESISQGGTAEGWTVPGEGVEGAAYDEYHVDDDALYEKIIETFYEEAEQQ
nr:LCP family protein [uncultured Mediterraneibacter sp.]